MKIQEKTEKRLFALAVLIIFSLLSGLVGLYFSVRDDLPQLPSDLTYINFNPPTEIVSYDGETFKTIGDKARVELENISPYFLKAIVAVEDVRFYEHHGFNHLSFLRALIANIKNQRIVQGGSTITQQLAKNLFFSFEKTWLRKLRELLIAFQLEATHSKNEILEAYCNQIYFGNGAYGIENASNSYFSRSAKNLNLLQAAVLAGLPHSPISLNPFINYDAAWRRARLVLDRMVEVNFISPAEREESLNSELGLTQKKKNNNPNSYFTDVVITEVKSLFGEGFLQSGKLRIFTTLDTRLQRHAKKAVAQHLEFLERKMPDRGSVESLQAAAVTIDNRTGGVRALLGGRDYSKSQFNRAISTNRMVGSSLKPIVFMAAMEQLGYHPATSMVDEPTIFELPKTKPWEPRNYNDEYFGQIILKTALAKSLNVISAKLTHRITPQKVIKTARKFGITSPLSPHYSLALGTAGISPLELASAFTVFANQGMYREPFLIFKIEDYNGNTLYEHFVTNDRRFPRNQIYPVLDMLQGVIKSGSGRVIRRMGFRHPAGGKTGTTNGFRDAWFSGFTKNYTTSVWVGFDSNEPMIGPNGKGITGAHAAAPIWGIFMDKAMQAKGRSPFPVPDGIRFENANQTTGFYEATASKNTIKVALPITAVLPRQPVEEIKFKDYSIKSSTFPMKIKHLLFAEVQQNPDEHPKIKTRKASLNRQDKDQLQNQIWFMLNLKKTTLGQLEKFPTSWLINLLKTTKGTKVKDRQRLVMGRRILIEKLIARIGSTDAQMKAVMTAEEIKTFAGQQ